MASCARFGFTYSSGENDQWLGVDQLEDLIGQFCAEQPLDEFIPYGRQSVDDDDIQAVIRVLRSDWLTTGPEVSAFAQAFADRVGARHAIAVSSGTAALHAAMYGLGVGPGDEVIVPAITFAASANCAVFQGAKPVFCDVDPHTLLIDPTNAASRITAQTRAIVAVDFAGQPCDYHALGEIAAKHDLALVADGCHALGAASENRSVGSLAAMTAFSFHPVKHIATGEGGMVTTDDETLAGRARAFRNHGINTDFRQRAEAGTWYYEMVDLGYNYRISDIQCALGRSQLNKLDRWVARRQEIAKQYDAASQQIEGITPLTRRPGCSHAYHLYVVRVDPGTTPGRKAVYETLRAEGIGANVHYLPVHLHPFYRQRFGTGPGLCPVAEAAYEQILSLPIYPGMTDEQASRVIDAVCRAANAAQPRRG